MSNLPYVWKIKDTVTGFYWGGPSKRCTETVGTRFERFNMVAGAFHDMIRSTGEFPAHWVVERVKIIEEPVHEYSGAKLAVLMGEDALLAVLRNRVGGKVASSASREFMSLYETDPKRKWKYIGNLSKDYRSYSLRDNAKAALRRAGIPLANFDLSSYWVRFKNDADAVMSKMLSVTDDTLDLSVIRQEFADRIGVNVKDI